MKKSVQKQQNVFSEKTAEKGLASCGQNSEDERRVYPIPGYLKNLGIKDMAETPGWTPPVFSRDNPKAVRPAGWKPVAAPVFLQGDERIRDMRKVRLYLSSETHDLFCAVHDGSPIFRGTNAKGKAVACVLAEIPGTETRDLYSQDWRALRNPELRATMDVELLLDSVDKGRMVYKTICHGDEKYFVLVEKAEADCE